MTRPGPTARAAWCGCPCGTTRATACTACSPVASGYLLQRDEQRPDAAVGDVACRVREATTHPSLKVAQQLTATHVTPPTQAQGGKLTGEEAHRERVVGEARDVELLARDHRRERARTLVEQVEVDLVRRERHAPLGEVLLAAREQCRPVVGDAYIGGETLEVALGQAVPVRLLAPVLDP